jgi:hypothetical protein
MKSHVAEHSTVIHEMSPVVPVWQCVFFPHESHTAIRSAWNYCVRSTVNVILISQTLLAQALRASPLWVPDTHPFFVCSMAGGDQPPKGLAGTEWLWTQGARSEDRYERASGSASANTELTDVARRVGQKTRVESRVEGSQVWQQEIRDYCHIAQKPMNFEPTRMMFYCNGRPCVVHRKLYQ